MSLVRRVRFTPVVLLLGALAGGCSCSGEGGTAKTLEIVSPAGGAKLDPTYDLLPDQPGTQLEARIEASGLDGALVTLTIPGGASAPTATVQGGTARIVFTLSAGGELVATATDADGNEVRSAAVAVEFDATPTVCRITQPGEGAVLGASDDVSPAPGFQAKVLVRCAGIELGNPVSLAANGIAAEPAPLGPGGLAEFAAVELLEGENRLQARAATNAGIEATATAIVMVETGGCRVAVDPPTGTVFNATGEGAHDSVRADVQPGAPMDAKLTVSTSSDCVGADFEVRSGATVLATGKAAQASTDVTVVLPEGAVEVRAVLSGAKSGASAPVRYEVDSVVPSLELTAPRDGDVFVDASDQSPAPGLQVRVAGRFSGIGAGRPFELVLDGGTAAEAIEKHDLDANESFDRLYDLPQGEHVLVVRAARASGSIASSGPLKLSSNYVGADFAITSPATGAAVSLGMDVDASTPGLQVRFELRAGRLAGASGTIDCGSVAAPFTVGGDEKAVSILSFDNLGCAGAAATCRATVTAPDGQQFQSAEVALLLDDTPAEVQLVAPGLDTISAAAMIAVQATTSCPGETQQAFVLSGATVLAAADVASNAVTIDPVALAGGENRLLLRVTDAAGNQTDQPFRVFVDASAPAPDFLAPLEGVAFAAADDVRGDLSDGFQANVRVAVDGELEGTVVELKVGNRAPIVARTALDAASGHKVASFDAVSLPEGESLLRACGVDAAGNNGCAFRTVTVSTGRARCEVTAPADGAVLGARADLAPNTPGVQVDMLVTTDAPVGSAVSLDLVGPAGVATVSAPVAADGAAHFPSTTFAQEGTFTLSAACTSATNVTSRSLDTLVRVRWTAPSIDLVDPAEGELFNLASPDRGTAPGFQADVRVRAAEPAFGSSVTLTVSCGQGPQVLPAQPVGLSQEAFFAAVALPDEAACDLTAVLEDEAGNRSAPVVRRVTVDRVAPTIRITVPSDGALFGAARDAVRSTPQFELDRISARADGVGSAGTIVLEVGAASGPTPTLSRVTDSVTANWAFVELPEGPTVLRVTTRDAAGNPATAQARVTVDTLAPTVEIAGYFNGQVLNRGNDTSPAIPGLQQNIFFTGTLLTNGTTVRVCSEQAPGTEACRGGGGRVLASTVLGGGFASISGVTMPEGLISIYAEAEDQALNLTAPSAPTSLVVDSVPPRVDSLLLFKVVNGAEISLDTQGGQAVFGPADDVNPGLAGLQVRVRAQVSGLDGVARLVRLVDTNPAPDTQVAAATTSTSGEVSFDVSLAEGGHRLSLIASDQAGNPASTPDNAIDGVAAPVLNFGTDLVPPRLAVLAPSAGPLLARDDLDPATPGLQFDLDVDSDAGAAREVSVQVDGAPFATVALPVTGTRTTERVTFPEGAHQVSASVTDRAGNATNAGPVAISVDSVAPVVTITAPAAGTISLDADAESDGFQVDVAVSYGQVEVGRSLVVRSSTGGTLGTITTDATGLASLRATLAAGAQALTAIVSDVSGNETASAAVAITIDTAAPSVRFVDSSNPIFFGRADGMNAGATACTPQVRASCDSEGAAAVLLIDGAQAATATVSGGLAVFSGVSIPAGGSARLQLKATDGQGRVGFSASRPANCDLVLPTITRQLPAAASVKYVAFGNPGSVAGAVADKVPGAPFEADVTVVVTGGAGGTVTVSSNLDGVLATQAIPAGATDPHTVAFTNLAIPTTGRHTLLVSVARSSRNGASASFTADVDAVAPAAVTPAASAAPGARATVNLSFAAPGSDGASGGAVASYAVRRAAAVIDDETKWAAATPVTATGAIVEPGVTQVLAVAGQAFERQWFYAVRALDALGNLAPLGDAAGADLRGTRTRFPIPVAAGYTQSRLVLADLDGDGRDDLVAGASAANSTSGQVGIYYELAVPASASACSSNADCTGGAVCFDDAGVKRCRQPPVVLTAAGATRFGSSIAAGDVNGDGKTDLLVAADLATAPGSVAGARDGAVHIFFGGTRLSSGAAANAIVYGKIAAADGPTSIPGGLGFEIAVVGDVNGDSISDLAATSYFENGARGRVLIFAGRSNWPSTLTPADALADVTAGIPASVAAGESGASCTVDTNCTGGRVCRGLSSGGAKICTDACSAGAATCANGLACQTATSGSACLPYMQLFGWRVVAPGDLNGDGFAEVVVPAPAGTIPNPIPRVRPVFVMSGALLRGAVRAEEVSVALYADDAATPVRSSSSFGFDVISLDVTGDAVNDIVAVDAIDGRVSVFSGALAGPLVPTALQAAAAVDGTSARVGRILTTASLSGGVVALRALGDVTGDGIGDFGSVLVATSPSNELRVFYGRRAWVTNPALAHDTTIGRSDLTREFGNFGVRAAGGRLTGAASRDIVLLDFGGTATVLSGP